MVSSPDQIPQVPVMFFLIIHYFERPASSVRFMKSCHRKFDFIFADPPYTLTELATIPDLVFQYDLLEPEGLLVFEHGKRNDFSSHPNFVEHRSYGSVNFSLFRAARTEETTGDRE